VTGATRGVLLTPGDALDPQTGTKEGDEEDAKTHYDYAGTGRQIKDKRYCDTGHNRNNSREAGYDDGGLEAAGELEGRHRWDDEQGRHEHYPYYLHGKDYGQCRKENKDTVDPRRLYSRRLCGFLIESNGEEFVIVESNDDDEAETQENGGPHLHTAYGENVPKR